MATYAACPKCKQTEAAPVGFTWWGGALGPKLFTHVKCQRCGMTYNGKTGMPNTNAIIIYCAVSFVIVVFLLLALRSSFSHY